MRALTSELDNGNPTDSFLRVLDQFAELRSYSSASPTVGGYRVLGAQRTARRNYGRSLAPRTTSVAAVSGARTRLTGFLSVLFIGGLGLAVLAGPANCPCSGPLAAAEQTSLPRLGYLQNADMLKAPEAPAQDVQQNVIAILPNTTFLEPQTSAAGGSPITTSALERAQEARVSEDDAPNAGPLPSKIEQIADAPPLPVRLAAATSVESDVPPTLPVGEVATPPRNEVTATEADEREPAATAPPKVRAAHKRTPARAYRSPVQQAARQKSKKATDSQLAQRAPRWAQQMFATPWHSQAFSYTR